MTRQEKNDLKRGRLVCAISCSRAAGNIAATSDDWDQLYHAQCSLEAAADKMKVTPAEAEYYLYLAGERARAIADQNSGARRNLSLFEALQVHGADGIMRVKSHIQQPRELRIPQFMA